MYARSVQAFIRVDVAQSRNCSLVQKQRLNWTFRLCEDPSQLGLSNVIRFGSQLADPGVQTR